MKTIEIIKSMPEIESVRKYKDHLVIRTNPIYIEGIGSGSKFSNPLLLGKFKIWLCLKKCPLHEDGWGMKGTNYKRRNDQIWYHPHFQYKNNERMGCYGPGILNLDPISRLVAILKMLKSSENITELIWFYGGIFIKNFLINDMYSRGFPNFFKEDWKSYFMETDIDCVEERHLGVHDNFSPEDSLYWKLEYREDNFMIVSLCFHDKLFFLRKFDSGESQDSYIIKNGFFLYKGEWAKK